MCFGSASHVGIIRKENQDSVYVGRNKFNQTLAVVCDGLGGYKGGKIASSIVMEMFKYSFLITDFKRMNEKQIKNWFSDVLQFSKIEIYKTIVNHEIEQNDFSLEKMATTIVCSLFVKEKIHTFWVGDSRAYLINAEKKAQQITRDHNLYNYLIDNGASKDIINESKDNLLALTNIVGTNFGNDSKNSFHFKPFGINVSQSKNNLFALLCSDGFYNFVDPNEYYGLIVDNCEKKQDNLILVSGELLKIGMQRLSNDNLSVVIVNIKNLKNST